MISALTNSDGSLLSRDRLAREAGLVAASLAVLISIAAAWFLHHGYILYYGDAAAHLNISRSIIDSRTPGYDQLGSVWLPLLHVICLPFVGNDLLWSTGLAGTLPVAFCFVIAGTCFYLAARFAYKDGLAASIVVACFALNPNVLYLASIPMTEVVFFAGLSVLLFALFCFREKQNRLLILLGAAASCAMSLTRYDGWFLIPFAGLAFAMFGKRQRMSIFLVFVLIASLGPLYWLAHNFWETGDALDFFRGPYSAAAIQGARPYPGFHDWKLAFLYYFKAAQLCTGWPLALLGIAGLFCAAQRNALAPVWFLLLTPLFYVWSIHSSKTPIHVPDLPPFTYYNTRYGIALVPVMAFAAGAIVLVLSPRRRAWAIVIPAIAVSGWLLHPGPYSWICWKESQVNSVGRRAWIAAGVKFFRQHDHADQGILTPSGSGDLTEIFAQIHLPLANTLHIGNGPAWLAATRRPDLVHTERWAVAAEGDAVSNAIKQDPHADYQLIERVKVKDEPPLEIYKRRERGSEVLQKNEP